MDHQLIAAFVGAVAAIAAALIVGRLSKPSTVVIEREGTESAFSRSEINLVQKVLKIHRYTRSHLSFSLFDVLEHGLAVVLHSIPGTSPRVNAESLVDLMISLFPNQPNVEQELSKEISALMESSNDLSGPLCERAEKIIRKILVDLIALNIIENYRADSQYHSVNKFILTKFGSAVLKQIMLDSANRGFPGTRPKIKK